MSNSCSPCPGKLRRLYRGQLSVKSEGGELLAVLEMDLETAVAFHCGR